MSAQPPPIEGNNTPMSELKAKYRPFWGALVASQEGTQTAAHDEIVGNYLTGRGYCSVAPFATQTYCACVNAAKGFPHPVCTYSLCGQGNSDAYVPSRSQKFVDDPASCPKVTICLQELNVRDRDNIITGVKQTMNCPGAAGNVPPPPAGGLLAALTSNPLYIGLFVLLLLVIGLVIAVAAGSGKKKAARAAGISAGLPALPKLPKLD